MGSAQGTAATGVLDPAQALDQRLRSL